VSVEVALLGDQAGFADDLRPVATGVHVGAEPLSPTAASLAALPGIIGWLRRLVRELTPDIVEGHEPLPAVAVGLAARGPQAPSRVYRRHHETGRRRLLIASRIAARATDVTAVTTETLRWRAAADDRVPANRVLVTPSGAVDHRPVSDAEIAAWRHASGVPPRARVIAAVARLRHEKGIDVLLRALELLDRRDTCVVVLGEGPEEATLRCAAARCGPAVRLLGHQDDVAVALAAAELVAIPSRRESFGRTAVETLAAGRPLVASAVGGLVEAVEDGVTGLLVPPDDPRALAHALRQLLEDEPLRRRMGHAARARYESGHTMDSMADAWLAAWTRALGGLTYSPPSS
jgi:glycosyltransferase involved in cell wall biosynthesis